MAQEYELIPWAASGIALLFAFYLALSIRRKPAGEGRVVELGELIQRGALTYLNKQYRVLIVFIIAVSVVLFFVLNLESVASFLLGAFFSALTANIGMRIATSANSRTAEACRSDINSGLRVAFSSGSVMGRCPIVWP